MTSKARLAALPRSLRTLSSHTSRRRRPPRYFISGGFAIVNEEGCNVSAIEAVNVSEIDVEKAKAGLAEFSSKVDKADSDLDKARAIIGVEVYSAMVAAAE